MMVQPSPRGIGAAIVIGVGLISIGVIALGFIVPEQLFDTTAGLVAFFAATLLMAVCAVIANLYDLRHILHNEFG